MITNTEHIIKERYKVGLIAGIFDMYHVGHLDIMRQAKDLCEYLIVAVGTDEFTLSRKNHFPIIPFEERCQIVQAIRYVDEVVPETNLDKVEAYNMYHFNVMIAGNDHENEPLYIEAARKLKEFGVDTIYIPRIYKTSSTLLRNILINNREVEGKFL
jgi:glycerol-3-phosphate cytidylyltransferase